MPPLALSSHHIDLMTAIIIIARVVWLIWAITLIVVAAGERRDFNRWLGRTSARRLRLIALIMMLIRTQERRAIYTVIALVMGGVVLTAPNLTPGLVLVGVGMLIQMATLTLGMAQDRATWRVIEDEERDGYNQHMGTDRAGHRDPPLAGGPGPG